MIDANETFNGTFVLLFLITWGLGKARRPKTGNRPASLMWRILRRCSTTSAARDGAIASANSAAV